MPSVISPSSRPIFSPNLQQVKDLLTPVAKQVENFNFPGLKLSLEVDYSKRGVILNVERVAQVGKTVLLSQDETDRGDDWRNTIHEDLIDAVAALLKAESERLAKEAEALLKKAQEANQKGV